MVLGVFRPPESESKISFGIWPLVLKIDKSLVSAEIFCFVFQPPIQPLSQKFWPCLETHLYLYFIFNIEREKKNIGQHEGLNQQGQESTATQGKFNH